MRPREQFVAAISDNIHARPQTVQNARFAAHANRIQIKQSAAAEVFNKRDASFLCQCNQILNSRLLCKSGDLEIRAVHAQNQPSPLVEGALVIRDASAIRSTHFAQDGVGFCHDVGNAERAADFNQLAARDDDLAAVSQRIEG